MHFISHTKVSKAAVEFTLNFTVIPTLFLVLLPVHYHPVTTIAFIGLQFVAKH